MSKFLDDNGLLYFWQKIKAKFVLQETGKGLSTNDFTTALKEKLEGLGNGGDYVLPTASATVLGGVKVGAGLTMSGDALTVSSDIAMKSDLVGLYNYKGNAATVAALPTNAAKGDVYNVLATGMNYVWSGTEWDALGSELTVDAITNGEIDTVLTK